MSPSNGSFTTASDVTAWVNNQSKAGVLASLDVDLVWAPTAEVMYPRGFATKVVPEGAATVGLEDKFRPHFFAGVATVVTKLFVQCRPDAAVFGEKDFQQLKVVTRRRPTLEESTT